MGRVYHRKRFSDYLGEERAIDDIVMNFIPDGPPPTPSPTPSATVTPTVTPTNTQTPTPTLTVTPTPTNTGTPTPTPTQTTTVTPTLTSSPTPTNTNTPTPSITPTLTPTPTTTSGPAFDPDAQAYIDEVILSGGTLSGAEQTAINTFFVDMKSAGLYSKFYYLHLFLGGTAGSNSINAVNPGTYDLTWQGTWTHTVSGSTTTQNNSNYAESGFVVSSASPSTTQTDFSFGVMMTDRNLPITSYQYQGIGTNTSNYMIIGFDWVQVNGITNFWSTQQQETISASGKIGVWNSMSRSGSTAWYTAAKFNGVLSPGLTISSTKSTTFTPSATPYDINLFRINGLNQYTIGGTALLNFAATYLSPSEMDTFASLSNDLQVAFNREIFT